ncbi:regulatory protein [Pseudorhizobium tarimense]|uniref:Regulatory protein RecX n=1 Tax=Pseudorhizobium tarimense TaxID=1079109 RepID=A0ABV2H2G2_9HYPH|nr:regulatory protein RecX [Pseudorhizobium tarimense]MCJ8518278.1 recombination regulator RecX [Pseudorhizobium tarimense]
MHEDGEDSADGANMDLEPTPRMLAWAKNSAAYRLSRRMMTEHELADTIRRKAKQKFEDISQAQMDVLAQTAVDFGHRAGALDDQSYAEVKVRSGIRVGKSKRLIARKLKEKGVPAQTATEALQEADDHIAAIAFARKRAFGPYRRAPLNEKRLSKEMSAFARNGFSLELAKKVIDTDVDDADEALSQRPLS